SADLGQGVADEVQICVGVGGLADVDALESADDRISIKGDILKCILLAGAVVKDGAVSVWTRADHVETLVSEVEIVGGGVSGKIECRAGRDIDFSAGDRAHRAGVAGGAGVGDDELSGVDMGAGAIGIRA